MLKVEYTDDVVFSFTPPNLCILGDEADFLLLAKSISDLTWENDKVIYASALQFVNQTPEKTKLIFKSTAHANNLCVSVGDQVLIELDKKYWERLFKFFILMSWTKATYYLNNNEAGLIDLNLVQDCNLICSSEF